MLPLMLVVVVVVVVLMLVITLSELVVLTPLPELIVDAEALGIVVPLLLTVELELGSGAVVLPNP